MKTTLLILVVLCSLVSYAAKAASCPANLENYDGALREEPTAESQLNTAIEKAKAENKLVFLRFSEVWCGHCTRMQKILDRPEMKEIFGAEFVDLKIDLTKTPKARQLYLKYAKNGAGVPWFAFLDTAAVAVSSSVGPNGNIGCPEAPEEIAFFVDNLKKFTKMSATQLLQVEAAFKNP